MEIIIDSRETKLKKLFLDDVKYENLLVGDIQIKKIQDSKNILCLERKTLSDLKSSLSDGRFSEQKKRLCACDFLHKGYVIEGHDDNTDTKFSNVLRQLIIRIQLKDKLCVFLTGSLNDTFNLVKEFKRKLEIDKKLYMNENHTIKNSMDYINTLSISKKANLTPYTCYVLQLSQIPGISKVTAKSIADKYNNWTDLLDGIKHESDFLKNLKNNKFGKKKYDQLFSYLII